MKVSHVSWCLSTLTLVLFVENVSTYRILGVFPVPQDSHFILSSNLMLGLAEKGHDVTIIAPFSTKNIPKNVTYKEITISEVGAYTLDRYSLEASKPKSFFEVMINLKNLGVHVVTKIFEHPEVKKLLQENNHFDVVIVEQFHVEGAKILAWYYNAPLILFSTIGANSWLNHLVGNPAPPSYIPELRLEVATQMTFFQRLQNVFFKLSWDVYNHFLLIPAHEEIVRKYFPDAPKLDDIVYNTSLILLNSDLSTNLPVPKVPNMIDIGGFHVKPPKPLPKDLQQFLDEAEEGVVYFSMGSRLKSADLPNSTRDIFLRVFSKLKRKVLWKWEDENLPNKPSNVAIRKWLPQQDILGHPNVKLFITHGGLLSKTEGVFHGVPLLALPVFGDQYMNAESIVASGFGLRINFYNLTEEYFEECVTNLLNDPKYRRSAKKMSKIFHDKPLRPLDAAAFWVEYVIRHGGAPHLRVAALGLNWYQYLLLDVAAFCVIFILLFSFFCVYLSRKIAGLFMKGHKNKTD